MTIENVEEVQKEAQCGVPQNCSAWLPAEVNEGSATCSTSPIDVEVDVPIPQAPPELTNVVNICSAEISEEEEAILPLVKTIEATTTTNTLLEEVNKEEKTNMMCEMAVDASTIATQPLSSALSHVSEEIAVKEHAQQAETMEILGKESSSSENPLQLEALVAATPQTPQKIFKVAIKIAGKKYNNADAIITPKKSRKRRRLTSEIEQLTRDANYRVSKTGSTKQLYASEFVNTSVVTSEGRPKRQIKAVIRYEDHRRTFKEQMKLKELQGKVGTGFLCPKCHSHLSYDARICWKCGLGCCYSPGIGVVILKDRNEISNLEQMREKEVKIEEVIESGSKHEDRKQATVVKRRTTKQENIARKLPEKARRSSRLGGPSESMRSQTVPISCAKVDELVSNANTSECDACLQLFLPSYLQRHRRRCHGLTVDQFSCPYCLKPEKTMNERNEHICKYHEGKPLHVSGDVKARTKLYLYNCPMCNDKTLTYGGIKDHLLQDHNVHISTVMDKLTCTCPFCLMEEEPVHRIFSTTDSLLSHIKIDHNGCTIIGMKLKIGCTAAASEAHIAKYSSRGKRVDYTEKSIDEDNDDDETELADSQSKQSHEEAESLATSVDEKYWSKLSIDSLLYWAPVKGISYTNGQSVSSLLKSIESRMERLQHNVNLETKRRGLKEDEEYLAENRLYLRGIRARTNKAESEALEKFMYKDQCEEKQRLIDYQNRSKKKTPQELEFDNILCRPIQICEKGSSAPSSKGATTRRSKCSIGESCDLCNGWYATWIVTKKEIEGAGGNILDAIDQIRQDDEVKKDIPSLYFRRITDEELPNDRDEELESRGKLGGRVMSRRNDRSDLLKLQELSNTVQFIEAYNEGLYS